MGVNKPQDDAKVMTSEYIKGATISDIAAKYGYSDQEVLEVVTKDVAQDENLPTQAQEDAKPAEETKKAK